MVENSPEVSTTAAASKEAPTTGKGIIDRPSNPSVDQTVEKVKAIRQSKRVTLFALVDHSPGPTEAGSLPAVYGELDRALFAALLRFPL